MVSFKKISDKIVIIIISVICGCAGFLGIFKKFDFRVYDIFLGLRPDPQCRSEVLLVDIDDYSIDALGTWPWTRDIYANLLIRMKELGAMTAVFDIEFLSPSNPSINPDIEDVISNSFINKNNFSTPAEFYESMRKSIFIDNDDYFARSIQFFGNTWLTINTGYLAEYSDDDIAYSKSRFLFNIDDPDGLIVKGNLQTAFDVEDKSLFEKLKLAKIDFTNRDEYSIYNEYISGFSPAYNKFISRANGAGFTNSFIDSDGSRRRVELLNMRGEQYVGQLVFAPLLNIIQPEKIVRTKNTLEILGGSVPSRNSVGEIFEWNKKNISIPVDEEGRMLVNWKHSDFYDSFKHESVCLITQLDDIETNIYSLLKQIDGVEWLGSGLLSYKSKISKLIDEYDEISQYKQYLLSICDGFDVDGNALSGGIETEMFDEYASLKKLYFLHLSDFSKQIESNELMELQDYLLNNFELFGEAMVSEYGSWFEEAFLALKSDVELYNSSFDKEQSILKNSFCIIGDTASGTTDLGTTPFSRAYPNVGLHANVYNTILTEDFIYPVNWLWGVSASFLLTLILIGFIPSKRVGVQILLGAFLIIIVIFVPALLMIFKSFYIPVVASSLIAIMSFLVVTTYRLVTAEKDKKFLKNTFGAYVSPDVVNEIVKNPNVAKLGGKSDELTALFSDVKTFSGFTEIINNEELARVKKENENLPESERKSSEELDILGAARGAERLVSVLNEYLGVLSDAIMAEGGTIDKYVGDEIVSFFGAPVPDMNNAFNACVAGIRMLQAEAKYNEENKDKLPINPRTGKPFYLHSRVGLNTGNMVVGNMGTDKKLNYTIMGNNVNLASRLEGTNKVYGSWIMISESTWKRANSGENAGKLVARFFDAVRVVNVNRPVRIVNILGLRSEMSDERIKAAELFNEGMKWYMRGADHPENKKDLEDFRKAYTYYKKANELYPEDESSKVFMNRCADFIKNGIRGEWDGVYTMASK